MPPVNIDNLFPSGETPGYVINQHAFTVAKGGFVWYTYRLFLDVKCSLRCVVRPPVVTPLRPGHIVACIVARACMRTSSVYIVAPAPVHARLASHRFENMPFDEHQCGASAG